MHHETNRSGTLQQSAMSARAKQAMVGGLVLCFALQTTLVYSDEPSPVQLQGAALEGSRLWHRHGCQVCHQLYGFGGFLGPDLTNVASRFHGAQLGERLRIVMTRGSGQMPPFELEPGDVEAFAAFLVQMDQTGRGQLRSPTVASGPGPFEQAVSEKLSRLKGPEPFPPRDGFAALRTRLCLACHAPFTPSPAGAPALANLAGRLAPAALDERLRRGKPPTMPPPTPAFDPRERAAVRAFLTWLGKNHTDVERRTTELSAKRRISLLDLPWWEYE